MVVKRGGLAPGKSRSYRKIPGQRRYRHVRSKQEISERQLIKIKTYEQTGKILSREKVAKLKQSGEWEELIEKHWRGKQRERDIQWLKKRFPEFGLEHIRFILRVRKEGSLGMTEEEKEFFDELYDIYPEDEVREELGSPKVVIAA